MMNWFPVALIAVPILASLWAVGFGVMAAREKKIFWRILCGLQALVGAVLAAAGWFLLGSALLGFGGLQIEMPVMGHGWLFFVGLGVLALFVAGRSLLARLQVR